MAGGVQHSSRGMASDRYEPLPGVAGMPKWLWGKLPRWGRIAVGLVPVAIVALILLLGPGIDESKDRRAEAERQQRAQQTAERVAQLRAEQRPRFERGTPAGRDVAARAALFASVPIAIQADARRRVAAGAPPPPPPPPPREPPPPRRR